MSVYRHDTIHPFYWSDEPGGPKQRGIRINRGRGWVFVPDEEVLDLANTLADHLGGKSNR